jgi:nicotinic acid mononucleotide adenylyltransferase
MVYDRPRFLPGGDKALFIEYGNAITPELSRQGPVSGPVLLVEVVSLDISSREIRQLVEEGRSIRFLVPDTVAAYMGKNKLYQRQKGARGEEIQGNLLGGWQE